MSLYRGTTGIDTIYVGDVPAVSVYLGNTEIWTAKKSYSYTFSGTTKPAGIVDVAVTPGAGSTSVSGGIIREGSSSTTDGSYLTLAVWGVKMGTDYYASTVTNGGLNNTTDRGIGPGLSNATGTKAVFAVLCGAGGISAQLFTWDGTTRTLQASLAGLSAISSNTVELRPAKSGADIVWTVHKNGTATSLTWTDVGSAFGLPGRYPCGVFRHIHSFGQFGSPGIRAYAAADI